MNMPVFTNHQKQTNKKKTLQLYFKLAVNSDKLNKTLGKMKDYSVISANKCDNCINYFTPKLCFPFVIHVTYHHT